MSASGAASLGSFEPTLKLWRDRRYDARSMALMARLAALISYPIGAVDESRLETLPFPGQRIAEIAKHPSFRRPLNRAASRELGLHELAFSASFFERLSASPQTRLCLLLVTNSQELSRLASICLAAAALHRKIVGMPLKNDRLRLRQVFGEEAFGIATREASLQFPALAEIAKAADPGPVLEEGDVDFQKERVIEYGSQIIFGFVAFREPELSRALELRSAPTARWETGRSLAHALTNAHCDHVLRLFRRRFEQWSDIIG